MAKLEIEMTPEEQARLQDKARHAGLPVQEWVKQRLFVEPPEDLALATRLAGEATLRRIWDTPEEDEAWRDL